MIVSRKTHATRNRMMKMITPAVAPVFKSQPTQPIARPIRGISAMQMKKNREIQPFVCSLIFWFHTISMDENSILLFL